MLQGEFHDPAELRIGQWIAVAGKRLDFGTNQSIKRLVEPTRIADLDRHEPDPGQARGREKCARRGRRVDGRSEKPNARDAGCDLSQQLKELPADVCSS